jgi:hypothetical protein
MPDPQRPGLVMRARHCLLPLEPAAATVERLSTYLALVDRPLAALLARDRLRRLGPGRFGYGSRPFRLLRFELVPSLELEGLWEEGALQLRCVDCRIAGLGRWERSVGFGLTARLQPGPGRVSARAEVSLSVPAALPAWSRSLAGSALDQVLDRLERRLERGLRKDLLSWLLDPAVSG